MQKNKSVCAESSKAFSFFSNETDAVYIKQEQIDNKHVWSIYNPAGKQIAYTATREAALLIALQNDFKAQNVH